MSPIIQAIVIFACAGSPVTAPPETSDAAPGWKSVQLDLNNCMREQMEVQNAEDPNKELDFRRPEEWMRAAAQIAMKWEHDHPGWYVYRIKAPDPNTGELPQGCPVTIKCPMDKHFI